jgi:hypothetical protein
MIHFSSIFVAGKGCKVRNGQGGFGIQAGARHLSLRRNVQSENGTYSVDTGAVFLGLKQPGPEASHSAPCSTEVKNEWSHAYTLPCGFIYTLHRENFTVPLLLYLRPG